VTEQDLQAGHDLMAERDLPAELDLGPMPGLDFEPELVSERDLAAEQDGPGQDGVQDGVQACHRMLLRLAGRMPDELLAWSRDWLAHGELGDLARAVVFWAVSQDAVLTEDDAALLSRLVTEADGDPSGLTQLTLEDFDPFPYFAFGPEIPPDLGGGTEEPADPGAQAGSAADEAAVLAVAAEPGAIGLWRAWRFPADGAPWPPPKRVFVVEVAGVDAPGMAARVQERLAATGEQEPQVEVYQSGFQIPIYQDFARTYGELLWGAAPDPGVRLAPIFDEVDADTGPFFRSDRPLLAEDEAARVVEYLLGGEPLLVAEGLMDDILDSTQVFCVPMSFRTDGMWVWNEASAYYVEQYQLEPEPLLLAHIRSNDYAPPAVDGVALHRALQVLQDSAGEEVAWMFDPEFDESESESESAPDFAPDTDFEAGDWDAVGQDTRDVITDLL